MDTNKWKSVAIRKEIVELAADIGEKPKGLRAMSLLMASRD